MRGVLITWVAFAMSVAGTVFPHLYARDFLDDASIVRWIAIPILIATSVMLVSHYTHWF